MPHIMYLVLQITKLHHWEQKLITKGDQLFFLKIKGSFFWLSNDLKTRMVIGCKMSFVNNDSGLWKPMKEQTF